MYSDELVSFAKANLKFLGLVEKTFAEWVLIRQLCCSAELTCGCD
jgi:hypothetical protein